MTVEVHRPVVNGRIVAYHDADTSRGLTAGRLRPFDHIAVMVAHHKPKRVLCLVLATVVQEHGAFRLARRSICESAIHFVEAEAAGRFGRFGIHSAMIADRWCRGQERTGYPHAVSGRIVACPMIPRRPHSRPCRKCWRGWLRSSKRRGKINRRYRWKSCERKHRRATQFPWSSCSPKSRVFIPSGCARTARASAGSG